MRIDKQITIECSETEMNIVDRFVDFLEDIDDDDWNDVMSILGKDFYDRVSDFRNLMKINPHLL